MCWSSRRRWRGLTLGHRAAVETVVEILSPIIWSDDRGLVCVLKRGIKTVILQVVLTTSILVILIVFIVILERLIAAFSRVATNRRYVGCSHFIFIDLRRRSIECDRFGVAMQRSAGWKLGLIKGIPVRTL